jgi:hypothetical protein
MIYRILVLALCSVLAAPAAELIVNGGFETGDFTAWTVFDLAGSSGTFYVTGAAVAPTTGFATAGPAGGTYYAVSDQFGPGTHVLIQSFAVPAGIESVTLSFDMFVNDQSGLGPIVNPAGLDHTASPNQHARVDLLTAAAGPFDTAAGVLANFYLGVDAGPNPHPYTSYVFDVTSFVAGGGTFQIRFAEVDNMGNFNQGVDNVSIETVPEPATWTMLLAGGAALAFTYRKRR